MLTPKYKQQLKAQAHKLNPTVLLGNQGLTPAVMAEIDRALTDHELIKIRIPGIERSQRKEICQQICAKLQAELVQQVGHICTIYRKNPT